MPAFVSTSVFPDGIQASEAVRQMVSWGIRNIELGSTHRAEDRLKEKLLRFPFTAITHNFFPPRNSRLVLNLASPDARIRKATLLFMKKAVDFAAGINVKIYTVHPGFLADPVGEGRTKGSYDFRFPKTGVKRLSADYEKCFGHFLAGIRELESHSRGKGVRIAVETQGSVEKKDYVLMARPEELARFFEAIPSPVIGINLNLGHAALAAKAWGFNRRNFIEAVKARVLAVEVTHNNGRTDEHRPLRADGWYMNVLKDRFFASVPVIFEGRNVNRGQAIASYRLLQGVCGS
ncbi:MAG: TIM barrel protein [Candidatus Omnitrophota bacterium]|nr:TIM barrel protein [Candidatus Omnitrophota bacterium]MDZ4242873.1 TIM barrel protein [Candidatus Omnitrophota bacterium]